jgi:putative transcriptional regulator
MHALLCLCVAAAAAAAPVRAQSEQPGAANGLFLVAKPSLTDPNFSRTVVLVTQTADFHTVGVIVNRPTQLELSRFYPGDVPVQNYRQPLFFGGPVMRQAIVAVFQMDDAPKAPAFHVLKNLYLTMHEANVKALLVEPAAKYRLYAGFSGWAPRQLESEMHRKDWYILPADEASVFREDTSTLWDELVARASGPRAFLSPALHAPR